MPAGPALIDPAALTKRMPAGWRTRFCHGPPPRRPRTRPRWRSCRGRTSERRGAARCAATHRARARAQVLYLETTAAGGVTWEEVDSARLSGGAGAGGARAARRRLSISIPRWCGRWAVGMDEFADGVVGAKSKNLAGAPARARRPRPARPPAAAARCTVMAGQAQCSERGPTARRLLVTRPEQ